MLTWYDLVAQKSAELRAQKPGMAGFVARTGGAPPDAPGCAGVRALSLACAAGHGSGKPRRGPDGHPADHLPTWRRVAEGLWTADRELFGRRRVVHTRWEARDQEIRRRLGWRKVYSWRRGMGVQPTLTEAMDEWGSGIAPMLLGRRFLGAVYLDETTRCFYDTVDRGVRAEHVSGQVRPPDRVNEAGVGLYDPANYAAVERSVRFYYAR